MGFECKIMRQTCEKFYSDLNNYILIIVHKQG
jgi:hypothetical protein